MGIAGSLAIIWGLAIWLLTPSYFIAAPAFSSFEFARTLAGFITAVLVTPLIEELAFRGVILARLSANYGAGSAFGVPPSCLGPATCLTVAFSGKVPC